ncbi:hypothetical protein SANT12839_093900 [Streptomyces antimycoticus]|uniref:Uncharacterized protein n=1 Tax=Streptomyces antimycoticus TaxID=68175 RepID=A0A4D4KPV0_9ACTN|nr:hypothetical protein SANT12839_093900 [Streptomyces antimycoticus]
MQRVPTHILYFAVTGPAPARAQDPIADPLNPAAAPTTEQDRNSMADALSGLVLHGLLPPSHGGTTNPWPRKIEARGHFA